MKTRTSTATLVFIALFFATVLATAKPTVIGIDYLDAKQVFIAEVKCTDGRLLKFTSKLEDVRKDVEAAATELSFRVHRMCNELPEKED